MAKTKQTALKEAPTQEEVEIRDLALDSKTLESQAQEKLEPDLLKKVKKIAYYTSENGLALEEACLLSDINFEYFKELLVTNDLVRKIIEMKRLQYKKDLLYTVSQKARTGDDKLALWLLERMYPEEFQTSRKNSPGDHAGDEDILAQAIEFIQKTGDINPLVKETSMRAVVIKNPKREDPVIKKLEDILK